jgi:hypothetical protein
VLLDDVRTDFIGKFLSLYPILVLARVPCDVNFDRVLRPTSLLEVAIVKQDQVCLHTIVNAWIYLLQPNASGLGTSASSGASSVSVQAQNMIYTLYAAQRQHVSIRLTLPELLGLAESFPGEFCELVKHLRLIPAHEDCVRDCQRVNLRIGSSLEIAHEESYCSRLWEEYTSKHYPAGLVGQRYPVSAYFVPIREAADASLLQMYVSVSESTQTVDLFNSDVVIHALEFAWLSYGQRVHYRAMFKYLCYLVLFSISNLLTFYDSSSRYDNGNCLEAGYDGTARFAATTTSSQPLLGAAAGLQTLVLCLAVYYIYEEFVQYLTEVRMRNQTVSMWSYLEVACDHLMDIWNILDVIAFFGTCIGYACLLYPRLITASVSLCSYSATCGTYLPDDLANLSSEPMPPSLCDPRSILAVVSVCQWFKILYFFRAFESTGPLVSMIFSILFDVRYFFLILGIILFGFSQAFWLISLGQQQVIDTDEVCTSPAATISGDTAAVVGLSILAGYKTWYASVLQVFRNSMGDPSFDFSNTSSPTLGVSLLVLFLIIYVIILLNILIALMSDTFNRIQSNGLAQWRLERCKIILEQIHLLQEDELLEFNYGGPGGTDSKTSAMPSSRRTQYIHVLKRAEFVKPTSDEYHSRVLSIYKNTQEILLHNKKLEDTISLMNEMEKTMQQTVNKIYEDSQNDLTFASTAEIPSQVSALGQQQEQRGQPQQLQPLSSPKLRTRERFAKMMRSHSIRSEEESLSSTTDAGKINASAPISLTSLKKADSSRLPALGPAESSRMPPLVVPDIETSVVTDSENVQTLRLASVAGITANTVCNDKTSSNLRAIL